MRHECSVPGTVAAPSSPPQRSQPHAAVLQLTSDENPPQSVSRVRRESTGQMVNPEETKCRLWDTPISTQGRGIFLETESKEKPGHDSPNHFKPEWGLGLTQQISCP